MTDAIAAFPFIIIAELSAGGSRFVCGEFRRYEADQFGVRRPIAAGSLKLRQRRHLAAGFGTSEDAEDWVNDAHNKPAHMAANGVAFYRVVRRTSNGPAACEQAR